MIKVAATLFSSLAMFIGSSCFASCENDYKVDSRVAQYSISPSVNYPHSLRNYRHGELINGLNSKKKIWVNKGTAGWKRSGPVSIEINLNTEFYISCIEISSAAQKKSGVSLPSQILVFAKSRDAEYSYIGDVCEEVVCGPRDEYSQVNMTRHFDNVYAKTINLVLYPEGDYLFVDEISIYGQPANSAPIKKTQPDFRAANEIRLSWIDDRIAQNITKRVTHNQSQHVFQVSDDVAPAVQVPQAWLFQRIQSIKNISPMPRFAIGRVDPFKKYSIENLYNNKIFQRELISEHDINEPPLNVQGIVVVNTSSMPLSLRITTTQHKGCEIQRLYRSRFVRTKTFELVPDPLVAIQSDLDIEPYAASLLIAELESNCAPPSETTISVCDKTNCLSSRLLLNKEREKTSAIEGHFSFINWAYFDQPLMRTVEQAGVELLHDIGTDTIVVPKRVLPRFPFGHSDNWEKLESYLKWAKSFNNILVYMELNDIELDTTSSEIKFKNELRDWYSRLISVLKENGVHEDRIVLYPIDELEPKHRRVFEAVCDVALETGARIFVTMHSQSMSRSLSCADIVAVQKSGHDVASKDKEIWYYVSTHDSKGVSPREAFYYPPINAAAGCYSGFGLWGFSDAGWKTDGNGNWLTVLGEGREYAMFYKDSKNRIHVSRRLLALKYGIQAARKAVADRSDSTFPCSK